ncbi:hypothetical protein DFJ73DRAFT_423812 [Zopfochytrium polystomum]|nr:hypothetical protein DFJ73DRAFT_423812 [Zopfochytrium polystomum]
MAPPDDDRDRGLPLFAQSFHGSSISSWRRYRHIPNHVIAAICSFLGTVDPHAEFALASIFSLHTHQAAAFRRIHAGSHEFDAAAASAADPTQLLDRLLAYCTLVRLPPRFTYKALCSLCQSGRVASLQWWANNKLGWLDVFDVYGPRNAIHVASAAGQTAVLQWIKEHRAALRPGSEELKYSDWAVDDASAEGHVATLQWWLESGLPLRYSSRAMDDASAGGHVTVLQCWREAGVPLKYTHSALDHASLNGRVEVLRWWLASGLEMRYTNRAVDDASQNGHVDVLQWWSDSGLKMKYSHMAMDWASRNGQVESLQWWKDSKWFESYTDAALQEATLDALRWWRESLLDKKFTEGALIAASAHGYVEVLESWLENGLGQEYSAKPMDTAVRSGNVAALQWWKNSGLQLKYTIAFLAQLGRHSRVRAWFKDNDLLPQFSKPPRCIVGRSQVTASLSS